MSANVVRPARFGVRRLDAAFFLWSVATVWFTAILLSATALAADDAKVDEKKEKVAFYCNRLREQRLFAADRPSKPCEFVATPLMRFDNPVSRIGDGMIFIWTDGGRRRRDRPGSDSAAGSL